MRALRDFNIPKIVTDDVPVFMGLIGDLFPALDVPRKRDLDFEKMVRQAAIDLQLQPEENFILKVKLPLCHEDMGSGHIDVCSLGLSISWR
jgi:dynein heavy chain